MAVGNLAPTCRKKSQEKKSSFRKAFSHKKHGFKEPKRGGAAGAASPDARPPKRPSFLPLCVGGHRPSISSNPGEQAWGCHGNRGCLWPLGFSRAGLASCLVSCAVLTFTLCSEQSGEVWEGCGGEKGAGCCQDPPL